MKLNIAALSIALAMTASTLSQAFMLSSGGVVTRVLGSTTAITRNNKILAPNSSNKYHHCHSKNPAIAGVVLYSSVQPQPTSTTTAVQDEVERLRSKAAQLRDEVSAMETQRAADMAKAAERLFQKFDINQDGQITLEELQLGLEKFFKTAIPQDRVEKLLNYFDQNKNGVLELEEFSTISLESLANRLQSIANEERQEAREAAKVAQMEAKVNEIVEKQMEVINNKDDVTGIERILSVLPYMLPLMNSLQFGRFFLVEHGDNPIVSALWVLYITYASIPFSTILSYVVLNIVSSNLSLNKLIRFNARQSMYLGIALIIPSVIFGMVMASSTAETAAWLELGNDAVFATVIVALSYSVLSSMAGVTPDKFPVISKAVLNRMPTSEKVEEMARAALLGAGNKKSDEKESGRNKED